MPVSSAHLYCTWKAEAEVWMPVSGQQERLCLKKKKKKGVSVAVVVVAGEIGSKILAA